MRVRIRHTKLGKVRFTSHRDTARHWERALRKAGLPVATSGGFTPRPKMSFGLALPTGAESFAEYLDVEFATEFDCESAETLSRMSAALPMGYEVTAAGPHRGSEPSLQEDVVACTWYLRLADAVEHQVHTAVERTLQAASLPLERERKGQRRTDDVRPAIESMSAAEDPVSGHLGLTVTLLTAHRGLRPTELVEAMFPETDPLDVVSGVVRTHQWIERDGARREPLPVGAAAAREAVA